MDQFGVRLPMGPPHSYMQKSLKFPSHFVEAILKQGQGITTRLFDEKNISEGDVVDFLENGTNKRFATVKIEKVDETTFGEAMKDAKDMQGMYDQYATYYKRQITSEVPMKIIHYEFVDKLV